MVWVKMPVYINSLTAVYEKAMKFNQLNRFVLMDTNFPLFVVNMHTANGCLTV